MLLWVAFAVLTALAALAIVWPLAQAERGAAHQSGEADIAIYREQLRSLEDEIARGLLVGDEAEAARGEIARRLLAAEERRARDAAAVSGLKLSSGAMATGLVVLVTAASLGFYLTSGTPDLPGQPLAERLQANPEGQDIETLLARVESHLAANPEDGQGWAVVAPVYLRMGRYNDAAAAFANAMRLQGETADRLARLGEALTSANQGIVTADARQAFARAAELEPGMPRARFYLAIALEQDGRKDDAIAAWNELLAGSSPDAPWRGVVVDRLAALGAEPADQPAAPGPSAADVQAAQEMSPEARQDMINQMVARLAARLAEDGKDIDGWLRLIRAYMVLGKPDDAKAALANARENFAGDEAALARLKQAAAEAGLEG